MAQDPWAAFNPQPAPNTAAPSGPVLGPPLDPTKQAADQRDETRTGIAVEGAGRDARRETRDITKMGFDQEAKLRDDFNANLEVKAYKASLPSLQQALKAPKNGQGDLSVIYAYAKIMDPNSVVREGEMDMVTSSSPWLSSKVQNLRNQVDSSGRLPEETRRSLEQEMIRTTAARRKSYETQYKSYFDNATSYGLDPNRVVGPKEGQAFLDEMLAYDKENNLGRFAAEGQVNPPVDGPRNPEMVGGLPKGSEIQFGMDAPQEPFDRAAYVQKTYGVTPQQEDLVIGFWNQNRDNQGLTVDNVKQWYQQNNLPLPSDEALGGMVDNAKKGYQFGPFDTSAARQEYEDSLRRDAAKLPGAMGAPARDPQSGTSLLERAKGATLSGWNDEAAGIGGAIGNALLGRDPITGYKRNRDMQRLMNEDMAKSQGWTGTALDVVGGMVGMRGAPGGLGGLRGAVASGATAGGVAGAGYGEGAGGTVGNALAGAVLGGGLGGALYGAGKVIQSRPGATASNADEIIAAGQREGVDVLTSDIRQPQTGFGKFVRRVGELTPLMGTGGKRAAQRTSREEAVRNLVAEFGDGSADDVSANLVKTRGGMIDRLTKAKESVINGIEGPVQTPRAVQAIDEQIAKLRGINEEAYATVIQRMESFKRILQGDKSLAEIEGNRKLLGSVFDDPTLAAVKGDGQKALNAIYGPLREDMGVFIKANAGKGAYNKWKGANDKLADMMDELDDTAFRRLLGKAETTPEEVGKIIFGKTPSTMRRLFNSVDDEGKNKIRAAIITRAFKDSSDIAGNVSPMTFARAIDSMDAAVGEFFPAAEKARLEGFKKLMAATQRSVEATSMPNNGAQLAPAIGSMALAPYVGKEAGALVATQGLLGSTARLYETKTVRNILMALSRTRPGTPGEATMIDRLAKFVTRNTANKAPQTEKVQQSVDNQMDGTVPVIPR